MNPKHRRWSEDEKEFLQEYAREVPYCDLACFLKRTEEAVRMKVIRLGLTGKKGQLLRNINGDYFSNWHVSRFVVDWYRKNGV